MKIATFNVNGVNGRLPRLLEWLAETGPDIVCLQELKTDDSKFPARALSFRMDFLLLSAGLVAKLKAAEVDTEYRGRERPSDHAPTWIVLRP